jgi:7,8-dihydropterin-6-yl-methyl-4-(beta-D-ribofuranosyl)aminobenzene 5'-phosphate synthase
LHQIQRLNNGIRIRAVIGGLHRLNAGGRRLDRTLSALRQFAPDCLIPCHCTGEEAVAAFQNALGTNQCRPGVAGLSCTFAHSSPHVEYG